MGKKGRAIIVINPNSLAVLIVKKDSAKKELKLPPTVLSNSNIRDSKKAIKLIVEFFADVDVVNKKVLVYLSPNIPAESNYPNLIYSCIEKVEGELVDVLSLKQEVEDSELVKFASNSWQNSSKSRISPPLFPLSLIFLILLIFGAGFAYYKLLYHPNLQAAQPVSQIINKPQLGELNGPIAQEASSSAASSEESPEESIKSTAVLVLNGSGKTGQAALVKNKLKGVGLTNVSTGNNKDSDISNTQVMVSNEINSAKATQIAQALSVLFDNQPKIMPLNEVGKYQIIIITGN
jgi:hypothetical protein